MRIFVTGGSGIIGSKFVTLLKQETRVFYTCLKNRHKIDGAIPKTLDVTDKDRTRNMIKSIMPHFVVHCSALTEMDLCETEKHLANAVNIEGTRNIVEACKPSGIPVVYISTSAVFDGSKSVFREDDSPNPVNYYGFTKLDGERIVQKSGLPFLILRTDQPYCRTESWQKKTTVARVLGNINSGNPSREVTDWYNTPTFVDNMVRVSFTLMEKGMEGIYHVVGPDFLSRYGLALKVAEIFGMDKNLVRPIKSSDLNLTARRGNTRLSNKKAEKDSGIRLLGADDGLMEMRRQLAVSGV